MNFKIYNMDVFEGLKRIEKNSVDCVVTSPPYWGLRDYGVEGQLGLEKHPKEYIENLVKVFRETKKVLKDSGSLWLNLGDTYWSSQSHQDWTGKEDWRWGNKPDDKFNVKRTSDGSNWLQPKQKMLMPHRVAIAIQEDGWILRNDIIWHKPSHMPSSVRDRLTNSFEYVFHFVKSKKYFYDLDSIREPHQEQSFARANRGHSGKDKNSLFEQAPFKKTEKPHGEFSERDLHPKGKNPGDMWSLTTEGFSEAHFACFPTKLVRKPLLATCPKEVCTSCGAAKEKIVEYEANPSKRENFGEQLNKVGHQSSSGWKPGKVKSIGCSDCGCGAAFNPGIVLDPFVGSGTTLLEAQNQGKSGIGIELNPEYVPLIKLRLNGDRFQESLNPDKIQIIIK